MQAFHFGDSQQPLFGIYHPAERERRPTLGAVLCNPFGEEAIRAHRIFRVLASRLAREGVHVLRFDYFGSGDSSGASDEGTPSRGAKDVRVAHDELVRRSGASDIAWVGLRYGANLALLASTRPVKLTRLVLCDPLPTGKGYLEELFKSHATYMNAELEHWQPRPGICPEALGWAITEDLARAMESLDLSQPRFTSAQQVIAILSSPEPAAEKSLSRLAEGQTTEVRVVQSASPWNSDDALNATLVPAEIVAAVVQAVVEPC
jgi:pimeloyl-ACP methyl ester carboxylesterase